MDLTIEAIEQDLLLAEQNIGRPGFELHLTRAQVRATLMAMPQPVEAEFVGASSIVEGAVDVTIVNEQHGDRYLVPHDAIWADRVETAAHILLTTPEVLASRLAPVQEVAVEDAGEQEVEEDEVEDQEEDIFADARKERRK